MIAFSKVRETIINADGSQYFQIEYRTRTGRYGKKANVRNRIIAQPTDNRPEKNLSTISRKAQHGGKFHFIDSNESKFDLYQRHLVKFNGEFINHKQ